MKKIKYKAVIEEGPYGARISLYKKFWIFWVDQEAGTRWLGDDYFRKYKVEKPYIERWEKLYGENLLIQDLRK